ncbi:MAG: site-2 protease family protein [Phototrophicales bacterium]|nr:MAG: site-2 protease family protein [Phototrophicales bacterium]
MLYDFSLAILVGRAIALVIGFTIHEFAHAWTAYRLGDKTAYYQGRLTLDPRAHLEPMGIVLALIVGFGWAKPVPVNPRAFYPNEQRGLMLTALAGPMSNLILAFLFGFLTRIIEIIGLIDNNSFLYITLFTIVLFNIVLFLFNLIPLAPLDGWKILNGLLPRDQAYQLMQYERESTFALLLLLMSGFFGINVLGVIFSPLIRLLLTLTIG